MSRARVAIMLVALLGLAAAPAQAALSLKTLATVAAHPAPGAAVPLDLPATELPGGTTTLGGTLGGRPALLMLADWRCTQLCGSLLALAGQATSGLGGLVAGRDFTLAVVGFNPDGTARDGLAMRDTELAGFPQVAAATRLLTLAPEALDTLERALGFTAVRDADRYAHPADLYVLTADGRVSRLLDGLTVSPETLRLALVEAGEGRIGSLADRLHVLCYGLLPLSNASTTLALTLLRIAAGFTLLAGGGGLILLWRRHGFTPRRSG